MVDKPQDPHARAALALLETYPGAGTQVGGLAPNLFEALVTLRGEVIKADWDGVFTAATMSLGLGMAVFRRLQGESFAEAALTEGNQAARGDLARMIEQFVAQDKVSELVAALREQSSDPELLAKLEADFQAIEQGKATTVKLLDEALATGPEEASPLRGPPRAAVVASVTRGLLGLVHAEMNRALNKVSAPDDGWPGIEDAFRYETSRFGEALRQRQLAIHAELKTATTFEDLKSVAALTRFLEEGLPRFARAQARVRLEMQTLLGLGRNTAAKKLGHLATVAGGLTREAIASQAAGYRLALDLADPAIQGGQLRTVASSLPFDKALPNGTNTALADIAQTEEGGFIEIEGFVDRIRVRRSADGKLIGELRLLDPANGTTASAAALFVQPLHVGITTGAFVRLSGILRSQSILGDGQRTVEVDRLPLATLAEQAWRLTFLRSAEPFYEAWRNQTNMYWSLSPHEAVTEDGSPVQGAAELIYPPFVRDPRGGPNG